MRLVLSIAGLMVVLFSTVHAADAAAGSVLVETQPARRGQMTRHLVAYGQATPAVDASLTLSVQAEGRVVRRKGRDLPENAHLARKYLETVENQRTRIRRRRYL